MVAVGHWECRVGFAPELLATVAAGGVAWGSPPDLYPAHTGLFQEVVKSEGHFINGTDCVRLVERNISNREQFLHFGSDVGLYWNSDPEWMEHRWAAENRHCWHNQELSSPFLVERRAERGAERVPSGPLPAQPPLRLCSVMDFYPGHIQLRWFQGQQELSGHVVAPDLVPNGDWFLSSSWCCWKLLPQCRVTSSCQVEHVSLEHPLSWHWEVLLDAARRKVLMGIGGSVLGLVSLALGLGFYLGKK
uniref:Ig-like domain-containing protein n=1 Tax=Ficedula albicollis TaxID=59894 RepID=A0A803V326_FICAL